MTYKKGVILFIVLLTLSGSYVFGCLWPADGRYEIGKPIQVEGLSAQDFFRNFVTHEDRAYWERSKVQLEAQKRDDSILHVRNNLAVHMIHLGQVPEAITLLEEVERTKPELYFTAANLGTAYELNGENGKALEWIKEGIRRNKNSHYGTEWLHVKILEAKLALERDPRWLEGSTVLGADLEVGETPGQPKRLATDHLGRVKSLTQIEEALVYQLHERMEFVKPPDLVVADLLHDLSRVFALTRTEEHARAAYELAVSYDPERIRGSTKQEEPAAATDISEFFLIAAAVGFAVLLVMGGAYWFIRNRRAQRA